MLEGFTKFCYKKHKSSKSFVKLHKSFLKQQKLSKILIFCFSSLYTGTKIDCQCNLWIHFGKFFRQNALYWSWWQCCKQRQRNIGKGYQNYWGYWWSRSTKMARCQSGLWWVDFFYHFSREKLFFCGFS